MTKSSVYLKKIFGTSTVLTAAVGTLLVGAAVAGAQFIDNGHQLIFDGQVVSISSSSMEIVTSGTDPITVQINNHTVFQPHNKTVIAGDDVHIIARTDNNNVVTARVVRDDGNGPGYGTGGQVMIRKGKVTAKTTDTFTIESNGIMVTFHVNHSTGFIHTNFAFLHVGDTVQVLGRDNGTQFLARTVIKQNGGWGGDGEADNESGNGNNGNNAIQQILGNFGHGPG